jgi:hypothetical protein
MLGRRRKNLPQMTNWCVVGERTLHRVAEVIQWAPR